MQYYRRQPLDTSQTTSRRTVADTAAGSLARQRLLTPFPAARESHPSSFTPAPTPADHQHVEASEAPSAQDNPLQDAAALVPKAASILDEEMAAGVLAARDVRRSTSGSAGTSLNENPGESGQLLRDVHNLIDAFADLVTQLQGPLGEWMAAPVGNTGNAEQESVPVLRAREPIRAGERAKILMKLHNDDVQLARLTPRCTDLLSSTGYRISARQVEFFPPELALDPDASDEITLHIGVPEGTPEGAYSGLLLASGLPYLRAVIAIEVE